MLSRTKHKCSASLFTTVDLLIERVFEHFLSERVFEHFFNERVFVCVGSSRERPDKKWNKSSTQCRCRIRRNAVNPYLFTICIEEAGLCCVTSAGRQRMFFASKSAQEA